MSTHTQQVLRTPNKAQLTACRGFAKFWNGKRKDQAVQATLSLFSSELAANSLSVSRQGGEERDRGVSLFRAKELSRAVNSVTKTLDIVKKSNIRYQAK